MKKLFLLSAVSALGAFSASAQTAVGSSSTHLNNTKAVKLDVSPMMSAAPVDGGTTTTTPSGKTTVGGSRWYSYSEYIGFVAPTISDSVELPYIWNKSDAKAIYGDGAGGVVADTIQLSSLAMSFDPAFKSSTTSTLLQGFNEPAAYDHGSIVVTRANAYTIDTVRFFSTYGRNNLKTAPVDTLRVALVYGAATGGTGTDMPQYFFSGASTAFPHTAFGYDTIRFDAIKYDKAKGTAAGTTRVIKDLYLKSTDTSSSIKGFDIPVGLNVPAGNVVGISVTFVTGHTYVPYKDTVFYSTTINPTNPFNMGMMRPVLLSEPPTPTTKSASGYPEYQPGYYNIGFVKFLPESASWDTLYVPSYAYVAAFNYELPDIDVKVSCGTCKTIKELGISESTIIADVNAYPNPTNSTLNIPFTLKEKANVNVSITNMVGQVVATQNLGNINAGQQTTANFNTSRLAPGIYMYTVDANGQKVSNRFSVAH